MKKLILLFSLFIFFTPVSYGGPSKSQIAKKKYRKVRKKRAKRKRNYNFVFERTWYHSLSPKQQALYLKTMDQLIMKMAGGKYSASYSDSLWDLFIEKASAGEPINNGYNYSGRGSYKDIIDSIDMGRYKPNCPAGEHPCAAYTGLVRNSSGEVKLACSPNSTPTCVQRGSQQLLRQELSRCGGVSPSRDCRVLEELMRVGTQGVRDLCESKRDKRHCDAAMVALEGGDLPPTPAESPSPSGANCDKATSDLIEAHQNSRSSEARADAANNNRFWTEITGFAQKACGVSNISSMMKEIGVCDVGGMGSLESGGTTVSEVRVYSRNPDEDSGTIDGITGFNSCIDAKVTEARGQTLERINRIRSGEADEQLRAGAPTAPPSAVPSTTKLRDDAIALAERNLTERIEAIRQTARRTGQCSRTETETTDSRNLEFREIEDLAEKIRDGDSLSRDEENQFRAATGLASRQFVRTFCRSGGFNTFRQRLSQETRINVAIQGSGVLPDFYRQLARAARARMSRCAANLESVEESGCRFYNVTDPNLIRGTEDNPVLIKNRENNSCSLVVGHEYREVATTETEDGPPLRTRQQVLRIQSGNTTREMNMSTSELLNDYIISVYRCDNDPVRRPTYRRPRGDDAGEDAAREYLDESTPSGI